MTVSFVDDIRSLTTGSQFHINFHIQDIAIIVKERYSEKFRYETKRPLGFLNESTATP